MTEDKKPVSRLSVLSTREHDRDVVGFRYVYPVVSRRAGGVSIGINLNPNNACNWRCVYCQVEGLVRGAAPHVDMTELERELLSLISAITKGDFLERHVAPEQRRLRDIALSGNGEPTSSPEFGEVIELLRRVRTEHAALSQLPVVLITNGSLADRPNVKLAIRHLSQIGGVVWFKLDGGSDAALQRTNSASTKLDRHLARLETVATLCPTQVQSCWFRRGGADPPPSDVADYLATLSRVRERGVPVHAVQLYTLARKSWQPEAPDLGPVPPEWLENLAASVRALGYAVNVAP